MYELYVVFKFTRLKMTESLFIQAVHQVGGVILLDMQGDTGDTPLLDIWLFSIYIQKIHDIMIVTPWVGL